MSKQPSTSRAGRRDTAEQLLAQFEDVERKFEQIRAGLTHSHRLTTLGTLASIVAHEYNNILTPIISYAQLALNRPDDHALMRKAVEKALLGAERAARISSSMLGFAQQDDEQADVAELRAAIDEAVMCLAREPEKDGIELSIDVPHVALAISPLSLQQVLLNLMLNARKAIGHRGGRLAIRAHLAGRRAHIEVADTGPGIPEQIKDRLFEPFVTQRINHPGDADHFGSRTKGTGLGLCICRDLITSAGGSIRAESTPDRGATFHIDLPIASPSADAQQAA